MGKTISYQDSITFLNGYKRWLYEQHNTSNNTISKDIFLTCLEKFIEYEKMFAKEDDK